MTDKPEFPIEYQTDVPLLTRELQDHIEERLLDLAAGNTDLKGASISVKAAAERNTPLFQARILVHMQPDDVVAVEKDETLDGALRGAVKVIERQVRDKRKKLRETWKRSDLSGAPGAGEQDLPDMGADDQDLTSQGGS
jgi:ribosome-associated translation inhibitor RaiA